MKYIEIVSENGYEDTIASLAEKYEASDFRVGVIGEDGKQAMRLIVTDDKLQSVLDSLQKILGSQTEPHIFVMPIEIELPKQSSEKRKDEDSSAATRELLYSDIEKNSQLNFNYILLVFLSTTVAAIGLIENNIAVVIGAMVIAPLLGPNLAFGLGTALGDSELMRKSAFSTITGILFAIFLSILISKVWPVEAYSMELMSRTHVGLDSVALALASGAAAALSMTTGLSSVLVGVMVAVALLPPAVTFGLMLGYQETSLAISAGLLLLINLVSVNLSCKAVFFIKGIRPRTWGEKKKAKRAMTIYILAWLITLIILVFIIYSRQAISSF